MSASAIRRAAIIRYYYYTGLVFPSLHGLFISCRRVSVCLSVTSRCSTEMAKRIGSHNTTRWPRDSSFLMPKISSKLKQGHPQRRRQMYRWGRLNAGAVAENWRLSTRSIANLARSQVYHTERPSYLFAARVVHRAGLSATADPCCL